MNFSNFRDAINQQFSVMANTFLFYVDMDKDVLWDMYLASFPEGSNPIYKERTEHDCQCCKQFIRNAGRVVSIVDGEMVSIWDVDVDDKYQAVADAMSTLVKQHAIKGIYLSTEQYLGTEHNHQQLEDGTVKQWEHFHFKLDSRFVRSGDAIGTARGHAQADKEVLERTLKELSLDSAEIVLELIEQNSLYRGEEHKETVKLFIKLKEDFETLNMMSETQEFVDGFLWNTASTLKSAGRIKNTVIGSLLEDLSSGMELDKAVKSFEAKVAPANYKRPTALVTKGMIDKAQKKIEDLGITDALPRRYAVTDDITINNVLFADRTVKKAMNVFDEMKNDTPDKVGKLGKVEEVPIDIFLKDILPKADSIEIMVENQFTNNFMSLIAPVNTDAPNILKWGNNFSWSYKGDVTDSMKERVKTAGGDVTGVLRFSIQWNEQGNDGSNDLDAHCKLPGGHIFFSQKDDFSSKGQLDVDITRPHGGQTGADNIAVENITWPNLKDMPDGEYKFYVNKYSGKNTDGFRAQVEMNGKLHQFAFNRPVTKDVPVATVTLKNGEFTIKEHIDSTSASVKQYEISTQKFHKVNMVMNSPNFWDDQKIGNQHVFFILDGCKNDDKTRGLYNEFLKADLNEHRKVFEVLGSKLKAEKSDDQLSGLGFSLTQKNAVLCKVAGAFSRTIKLIF